MTIRNICSLRQGALTALAAAVLVTFCGFVLTAAAHAEKFYDSTIGTQSASAAGFPPTPAGTAFGGTSASTGFADIAVNAPSVSTDGAGHAGWVYIVDRGNNRIQAFDQNRNFQWAIGRDVIAPSVSEVQILTVDATGGQFKLEFNGQTTIDLAHNATPASIDTALGALSTVGGAANVVVTGTAVGASNPNGRYAIQFSGTLANADQNQITVQPGTTPLTGGSSISTLANGTASTPGNLGDVFEKCTVAAHCKAGSIGTATDGPGGEFNTATGIDIDQATGDIFVGERNANARVQQFSADGGFIRAFGWDAVASGPGDTGGFETCNAAASDVCKAGVTGQNFGVGNPGQFGSSTEAASKGLAIPPPGAPNAGQIYVADPGSCRVQRFAIPAPDAPTSAVVAGVPFGVPSVSGAPNADNAFCPANGIPPTPAPGFPRDVAADANGVVYANAVDGSAGGMIKRFDTAATSLGTFQPHILVGGGGQSQIGDTGGAVVGLAVDPDNDHLLLARSNGSAPLLGIVELDLTDNPAEVTPDHVVGRHLVGFSNTAVLGLGAGAGRYFLSTNATVAGSGSGSRVLVLDDDGVEPDPVTTVSPVTNVGSRTATFSGSIDPVITAAFPTSYRWQISKDGVNWIDVTSDVLVGGNGFSPQSVTTNAADLEPNTLYRVRIRTSRAPAAGFSFSAELLFQTDPEPPTVETRPAQRVADTSAYLVGNLNPGGLAANYWFEWGDNEYGNRIPAISATAAGGVDRLVGENLSGLRSERVYHYRLCAQSSFVATKVCGADATFTTRSTPAPPAGRTYEMVTSEEKSSRRGAHLTTPGYDFSRLQSGLPAISGGIFAASYFAQPADPGAGYGNSVFETAFEVRSRGSREWSGEAIFNVPILEPTSVNPLTTVGGWSADLRTSAWGTGTAPMVGKSWLSVRRLGDSGGPRGAGWYRWLDLAWASADTLSSSFWEARVDDAGERMLAESESTLTSLFRDVTPLDDTVPPSQLSPNQTAGRAVFIGDRARDWRPADLVNECTGSGASATQVPSRSDAGTPSGPAGVITGTGSVTTGSSVVSVFDGAATMKVGHFLSGTGIPSGARITAIGTPDGFGTVAVTISTPAEASGATSLTGGQSTAALADDTISSRSCAEGSPTDVRGASFSPSGRLRGSSVMSMSDDGSRVFFVSPDPTVTDGQEACSVADGAVGDGTACPPQLFVRQFDDEGNPTVRWLSRPEDGLFEDESGDPQMKPAALGSGVSFEGASRDGSVVYFRTDAPLTTDDPNGERDRLEAASPNSWDLYRYDLGTNNNTDPGAGDSGDRLTRISAGPGVAADPPVPPADPNTNCKVVATAGPESDNCWGTVNSSPSSNTVTNGEGAAVRFLSDDGRRVYFVTAARIPGAVNSPPTFGATSPTTGTQANATTRNLYLYDASRTGASAYKFIAQLPFSTSGLNACASFDAGLEGPQAETSAPAKLVNSGNSCVHGSGSGDSIVFTTKGQLTTDDADSVADVYVYDAASDALHRLSAPGATDTPYACAHLLTTGVTERCNADLGFATNNAHSMEGPGSTGQRHWNVAQNAEGELTDIYFESRLPLVPEDKNSSSSEVSGGMDVYRWRRVNGRLSLVSPGIDGGTPTFYNGNSLDGQDIFFWTEQRISKWERDQADADIYNATTRTPLPLPPPDPISCDVIGQECQGGGTPPVAMEDRTSSPVSDDNVVSRRGTMSVARFGAKARKRAAKTGVLPLRVKVDGPSRVTAVAKGWFGRRTHPVGRSSGKTRSAGILKLPLRLNSDARAALRRGKALRLSVEVTSSIARTRSISVRLKRGK